MVRLPPDVGDLLAGVRLVIATDDPALGDALASELRLHGAVVGLVDPRGRGLGRTRAADPHVVLVEPDHTDAAVELRERMARDVRLRWASVVPCHWERLWPAEASVPDVQAVARLIEPAVAVDRVLQREARGRASRIDLPLAAIGPARALRALSGSPDVLRMRVASPEGTGGVDLVEDLLLDAWWHPRLSGAEASTGVEALARVLTLRQSHGSVVRRLRPRMLSLVVPLDEALSAVSLELERFGRPLTSAPLKSSIQFSATAVSAGVPQAAPRPARVQRIIQPLAPQGHEVTQAAPEREVTRATPLELPAVHMGTSATDLAGAIAEVEGLPMTAVPYGWGRKGAFTLLAAAGLGGMAYLALERVAPWHEPEAHALPLPAAASAPEVLAPGDADSRVPDSHDAPSRPAPAEPLAPTYAVQLLAVEPLALPQRVTVDTDSTDVRVTEETPSRPQERPADKLGKRAAVLERALAENPRNTYAMADMARLSLRAGKLEEALNWVERAVALRPRRAPYRLLLGDVWMALGRPQEARAEWQWALELRPSLEAARQRLGP